MSRAFVKEQDGAEAFDELPEKLVSPHRNFVTAEGLAMIEAEVARLSAEYAHAQASGERAALNSAARDLRYWTARRASAELVAAPSDTGEVRFGSRVTIAGVPSGTGDRNRASRRTFRIVGEDEADPASGTLSYVSPLARALMGKEVGDEVRAGGGMAEIVAIGT